MGPPRAGVTNTTHAGGLMLGTLEYMSPEQTETGSRDIDARSDVYSLGALLYRLVCGRPPLECSNLKQPGYDLMLRLIREEVPRPASRVARELANGSRGVRELDRILAKALEKTGLTGINPPALWRRICAVIWTESRWRQALSRQRTGFESWRRSTGIGLQLSSRQ